MKFAAASLLILWLGLENAACALSLEGKALKVVTILNSPFVQRDTSPAGYKGYYIDMLNLLQRELKFTYEIYEVADSTYGRLVNGTWTGLVGDIVKMKANVTLATLRMTGDRLKTVDFTVPVSSSGMSVLLKKAPSSQLAATAAMVLKPFAPSTWILLLLVYAIYCAIAFVIWLLSPYELNSRFLGPDSDTVTKASKAGCGAWLLVTGGLFLQGFARTPKAPSARVLAFFWWLFALLTFGCYVANLVQVLGHARTAADQAPLIGSLRDLVKQTRLAYGVIMDGATQKMLEESNQPEFQEAHNYLRANPANYVRTIAEAVERVREGNYAWIAEGVTAEYYAMNQCDLDSVPAGLNSLDFGLAVAKGSELKGMLDAAILKLKTTGELAGTRGRWWAPEGGPCDAEGADRKSKALSPGDLAALFALLLLGGLSALATLPIELRFRPRAQATTSGGACTGPEKTAATAAADPGPEGAAKEVKEDPLPESRPLV